MNQTLSLYRLQQVDSQIDRAQARLQALQMLLEDDARLRQASEQAQASEKNRKSIEQNLKRIEATVQDQRIKIEQTESNLYSGRVHNPKELQDLENDVASLKRHLASLEDNLLETMIALDEAEIATRNARTALQAAQAGWSEQNQALNQEQSGLLKEMDRLSTERAALTGTITSENLSLYDQLRQQRSGMAVSTISDSACAACGSRLTPAQVQDARSAAQMSRCPSCGRILYGA